MCLGQVVSLSKNGGKPGSVTIHHNVMCPVFTDALKIANGNGTSCPKTASVSESPLLNIGMHAHLPIGVYD